MTPDKNIPKLGARSTRQRAAVVTVLRDMDNFASAKAIHDELSQRNQSVGLTTVYRTLQSLADIRAVDVLHMASGESLYRSCDNDRHHHHLVCTECGRTVEIEGGPVERWAREAAGKAGFFVTGHTAEVFGLCALCRQGANCLSPGLKDHDHAGHADEKPCPIPVTTAEGDT